MEIRRSAAMLPTRPCRWCLSLQDDSVFADFDIDSEGRVFLRRVSFDGFGCTGTGNEIRRMDAETSGQFLDLVETDVGSKEMASILSLYFRENSDVIWKDALEAHKLLGD